MKQETAGEETQMESIKMGIYKSTVLGEEKKKSSHELWWNQGNGLLGRWSKITLDLTSVRNTHCEASAIIIQTVTVKFSGTGATKSMVLWAACEVEWKFSREQNKAGS